ncbi:MAG: bifunctional oligoribonuclease/PAP phosphatase NrnA [Haloferacaceae archaeon]
MQLAPEAVVRRLAALVRDRPELAIAVLLGIGLLVAGAYFVWLYRRPAGRRLFSLLADRDAVTVLVHPNPDPDAMAAAMGVEALAEQAGAEATIRYSGTVGHQENRAFRTVLDLEMEPVERAADLGDDPVILVDHNQARGFEGAGGVTPLAVVDHHPGDGTAETFTDVRTEYGAAASLVGEYFEDVGALPVPPDDHASEIDATLTLPSKVATGLLYGILSDTDDLTRGAVPADFAVASYLRPGVDEELLDRIANPQVSAEVLEAKARAIAGREVRGPFAVSDVGTLSNADALPQAADELVALEGVTAVVVCGEVDGVVRLSGRSRDDRVHMGRVMERTVDGLGEATGGGHARMGGAQISRPGTGANATDGGGTVGRASVDRSALIERLFAAMGGEL